MNRAISSVFLMAALTASAMADARFFRVAQTNGTPAVITKLDPQGHLSFTSSTPLDFFQIECTYDLSTNLWGAVYSGSSTAGSNTVAVAVPDRARAKGQRMLGLDVGPAESNTYAEAFTIAQRSGMDAVSVHIQWDEMETAPGVYTDTGDALAATDSFYPANHTQVALTIAVIDTIADRRPSDLSGLAWSDPTVVGRFTNYLAWVMGQLPNAELCALAIGNEVDGYLGSDTNAWNDFAVFHYQAVEAAHELRPGVPVGLTTMLDGAMQPVIGEYVQAISDWCDGVFLTYYPLESDFTIRPLEDLKWDWMNTAKRFGSKPIYFMETGLPSSPSCGSSLQTQADFIRETFLCWDTHADIVPLVLFNWQTDWSSERAWHATTNYYQPENPEIFAEYLRTLGLRTWPEEGTDKPAYTNLISSAAVRGWPASL